MKTENCQEHEDEQLLERMQNAIDDFCSHHESSSEAWKRQPWIAKLFAIRSERKEQ